MNKFYKWLYIILFSYLESSFSQYLSFNDPQVITNNFTLAKRLKVVDLDQDQDMDVLIASSNQNTIEPNMAWFENINNIFTRHVISTNFIGARTPDSGDLNNDGYIDVAGASRGSPTITNPITWWENDGSNNGWLVHPLTDEHVNRRHTVKIFDLNEDGFEDIITAVGIWPYMQPDSAIIWFQNSSTNPGVFNAFTINRNWGNVISLDVTDLDNDGDWDIIFADVGIADEIANDAVAWLENDGQENFTERGIDYNSDSPMYIHYGDVDNDGNEDILVCNWGRVDGTNHDVFWYRNDGRIGSDPSKFWNQYQISGNFYNSRSAIFIDLNGDGWLDVLGAACDEFGYGNPPNGGYVTYWLNDGSPLDGGWSRTDLITDFDYAYHAVAEDMDDDGDYDVIASSQDLGAIYWWENTVNDIQQNVELNTDYDLWNSKVRINFSLGPTGSEYQKVFFNSNKVPNRLSVGDGVDHVAVNGFYTLKTDLENYIQSIEFSYSGISEWSNAPYEDQLLICYWDGSQWVSAPNQSIDIINHKILVTDFVRDNNRSVIWTLGSATSDNPLPIQLLTFQANSGRDGIQLNWTTVSEINNIGFEIWRSDEGDTNYILLSDYRSNQNLVGSGNSTQLRNYSYTDKNVRDNFTYRYNLIDVDVNNQKTLHGPLTVTFLPAQIVSSFELGQNYPNPFNGSTRIPVYINSNNGFQSKNYNLKIFNLLGEEVRNLDNVFLTRGRNEIFWDGKDNSGQAVASGQYIYRLSIEGQSQSRSMLLVR